MHPKDRGKQNAPNNAGKRGPPTLSWRKKLLFSAFVTVLLFTFLEASLWVAGLRPVSYDSDPYIGFTSQLPLFEAQSGADGVEVLVTARNKLSFFNEQKFPKKKTNGAYRIFCMGGSTTYGSPYDDRTSFGGWLRAFLLQADSTRKWEVINAGGISYASYRVAVLMEELIRYQPDLFIIYSGQNEFLERRTYGHLIEQPGVVRGLGGWASRTRSYAALKQVMDSIRRHGDAKTLLSGEVKTRLDSVVGPQDYHRDDEMRRNVLEHYRYNLRRMISIARSVGARVVLVVPASNLRDCTPFKSQHRDGLSEPQIRRWQALYDEAERAHQASRSEEALVALEQAMEIDARYAHLQYLRGRVAYHLGRYELAKEAFVRSIDEDVCPLRALPNMLEIVREVAAEQQVPLVDFASLTEQWSAHGIPGEDLFLDHVHPTIEGHRKLAEAILGRLAQEKVVQPDPEWDEAARARVAEGVMRSINDKDRGIALLNLSKVIGWAGKQEDSLRLARKALALNAEDPDVQVNMGILLGNRGDFEEAVSYYRTALGMQPTHLDAHTNLGVALASTARAEEALVHFRAALKLLESTDANAGGHVCSDPVKREQTLPRLLNNIGQALSSTGQIEESIEYFERALRLRSDDATAHNNLGIALTRLRRFEEAVGHFEAALRLQPDFFDGHNNIGVALTNLRRLDDAERHYQSALLIRPGAESAIMGLERVKRMRAGE